MTRPVIMAAIGVLYSHPPLHAGGDNALPPTTSN